MGLINILYFPKLSRLWKYYPPFYSIQQINQKNGINILLLDPLDMYIHCTCALVGVKEIIQNYIINHFN